MLVVEMDSLKKIAIIVVLFRFITFWWKYFDNYYQILKKENYWVKHKHIGNSKNDTEITKLNLHGALHAQAISSGYNARNLCNASDFIIYIYAVYVEI